ncbi:MAG TPA: hypothetical protein VJ738_08385 [Steroidobacteraceae bacterium]|nr:hypothetical protein [Steroidobacteraceae bacterium]
MTASITWPNGKAFAFSVFDDTDLAVPGNFEKVYELLGDLGIRTTKSVWPISGEGQLPRSPEGSTCEDDEYLAHILKLQRDGFEIGYHNSSHRGVTREGVRRALDRFRELFGTDPACMSNHERNPEGIYWGADRLSQPLRTLYRLNQRRHRGKPQQGHIPSSPYFWGDLCRERIRYVRSFVFDDINTLASCPSMPYYDPTRPFVRGWFASTYGSWGPYFLRCLSESRQDELEASGGACIVYTHFASGFQSGSQLQPRFVQLMRRLASKNGWFVPVSQILDHIEAQRGVVRLTAAARHGIEWRWIARKITVRGTE